MCSHATGKCVSEHQYITDTEYEYENTFHDNAAGGMPGDNGRILRSPGPNTGSNVGVTFDRTEADFGTVTAAAARYT